MISDSALTSCVARLREALRDQDQQLIRTIHGYGYRLVAPVTLEPSDASRPAAAEPIAPLVEDEAEQAASSPRRWRLTPTAVAAMGVLALAGALIALPLAPPGARPAPSIAVLPFANMSADAAANTHIVDGLHDTLITQLTRIGNLKVISRTSVRRYRDDETDIREIAKALGVDYVLEGSVQVVGSRMRVNVQLIEAARDAHLWAEIYDRDFAEILDVQSELAQRVVAGIGARMTEVERAAIQPRIPASSSAYEIYLRAREQMRADDTSPEPLFRAQALLERAIAEDPGFALAHAALSRVHMYVYWLGYDTAVVRREQGRAAAEQALALNPNLAEAHLSEGLYRSAGFRDYVGALEAYERALALQPNSAELHQRLGSTYRRLARWDDALASYARALELDPMNPALLNDAANLYRGLRRYDEAARQYGRLRTLTEDQFLPRLLEATLALDARGELAPLEQLLRDEPRGEDSAAMHKYFRYLLSMWQERYADAAAALRAYPSAWMPSTGGGSRIPKEVSIGVALALANDPVAARVEFARARALLAPEMARHPNDAGLQLAYADVLTGLGEREDALSAVGRALDLMAEHVDPVSHSDFALQATIVLLRLGERERALRDLERLYALPYGPSLHVLQVLPYWKDLRGDPRFEALVARAPSVQAATGTAPFAATKAASQSIMGLATAQSSERSLASASATGRREQTEP